MDEHLSPWTKFDSLPIKVFRIYNFSSLEIMKRVAFRKSYHQCDISHTQMQKKSLDFLKNLNIAIKNLKIFAKYG